jgi:hypothetical protein
VAGVRRVTEGQVEPGSAGHAAALRLLEADPAGEVGDATTSPRRHPDAFRYDVSISGPDAELWRTTVRDPLPDDVATLLDAVR